MIKSKAVRKLKNIVESIKFNDNECSESYQASIRFISNYVILIKEPIDDKTWKKIDKYSVKILKAHLKLLKVAQKSNCIEYTDQD